MDMNETIPDEDNGVDKEEILAQARERLYSSSSGWDFILQRIRDDIEFSSGRQWDPATEKVRQGRPNLVLDKTKKFVDKVVGSYRNAPPGINVSPRYNSSKAVAEAYECYIRNVLSQPASKAAIETAGEHAAICGYGWINVSYDYESPKSFELVPKLIRIDDPRSVRIDRSSTESDGSDAMWGFRLMRMDITEAKSKYGEEVSSWETIPQQYTDQWVDDQQLILAEYWWIDEVDDTLCQCIDMSGKKCVYWMSELAKDPAKMQGIVQMTNQRETKRKVCNYAFLGGAGVIETKEWPCASIPLIPVYGRQAWQDNRQFFVGLIRPMMDAQRLINYYASTIAEVTALSPRVPIMAAEGQIEGYEQDWNLMNVKNIPYLQYRPVSLDGSPVPPPQRLSQTAELGPLLQALTATTQDLTDVSGIYEASLGQETQQKSGVAIREASKNSDQVLAVFSDNLKRGVVRCAQIIKDMMPNLISEDQILKLKHEDNSEFTVKHNPTQPQMEKKLGMKEPEVIDFTLGDYDVSVESGDSYSTRRQESAAAGMELMQVLPDNQKAAIAPEVVQNQDWVGADRIARTLRLTLPPELQNQDSDEIDPQAKALLDGMKNEINNLNGESAQKDQQIQQMQEALKQLTLAVENTQFSDQTKERIADKKNYTDIMLKMMENKSDEDIALVREQFKKMIEDDKRDYEGAKVQLEAAMKVGEQVLGGSAMSHGMTSRNRGVPTVDLPRV